jgi:Carboxypeptidase regulatory-like domain/AhpC/TSA family
MSDHVVRFATPLGRRTWVIRATVVLFFIGSVRSAGSVRFAPGAAAQAKAAADAPLPETTPAELAAKIREAMGRYDDKGFLRVVFTGTEDLNFRYRMNQGKPDEQAPIMVSFRGRARHESDGTRWRTEYDAVMPSTNSPTRLWPDKWSTGFDGTQQYNWQVSQNQFILGECSRSARQWTARSLIWDDDDGLVQTLEETDRSKFSIAIKERRWDGLSCYVVETKTLDGEWGGETVISPSQGYLATARKRTRRGKTFSARTLQGVHEVVTGIWAPERIEDESITVRDDGSSRLSSRRRIQLVEYRPRQAPPAAAFQLKVPYGVDVVDLPHGSCYHNDPWWPEVAPMLREKFGWPKPDFSPLRTLGSSSERNLDGQPAPPLRIASWLNSKPIDLAAFRGKVVLVEFGSVQDFRAVRYAPILRELYSIYHPAGLEIISIHVPTEDADAIRRFTRDYQLPYPVVIDEGKPGSPGITALAFGVTGRICAFLVDHEGKIHSAGTSRRDGGRVVETIVSLLQKSGSRNVKAVSLEPPRLPNEAFAEADKLFNTRADGALSASPRGKITGRIVDASGQPQQGAEVRASLQFTMLMFANPGGYFNISYRGGAEPFTTSSGADGRFEVSNLCKGAYIVRVTAPGRAWSQHEVFIRPELNPESVEFVLNQGDSISGRVYDQEGKPITGATVTPTERHHYEGDTLRYIAHGGPEPSRTDDAGHFRFSGLQEGRYVFGVKAAGFKDRKLEPIPAGAENIVVTLERSP